MSIRLTCICITAYSSVNKGDTDKIEIRKFCIIFLRAQEKRSFYYLFFFIAQLEAEIYTPIKLALAAHEKVRKELIDQVC